MSMHSMKLAHDEERPCFACGTRTRALSRGVMEPHPRCPGCKERFAEEHARALVQRRKQDQASKSVSTNQQPRRED